MNFIYRQGDYWVRLGDPPIPRHSWLHKNDGSVYLHVGYTGAPYIDMMSYIPARFTSVAPAAYVAPLKRQRFIHRFSDAEKIAHYFEEDTP